MAQDGYSFTAEVKEVSADGLSTETILKKLQPLSTASTRSTGAVLPSLFLPRPLSWSPSSECRGNLFVGTVSFSLGPNARRQGGG